MNAKGLLVVLIITALSTEVNSFFWRRFRCRFCGFRICCSFRSAKQERPIPNECPKWILDQNNEELGDLEDDPCPQMCKDCRLNAIDSEECSDCISTCQCVGLDSSLDRKSPSFAKCPSWEVNPDNYKELQENFCPGMCKSCQKDSLDTTECGYCKEFCHCPGLEKLFNPERPPYSMDMCPKWVLDLKSSQERIDYFCSFVCNGCQENSQDDSECVMCAEFCQCKAKKAVPSGPEANEACQWQLDPAKNDGVDPEKMKEDLCPDICKECSHATMDTEECKTCAQLCHCVGTEAPPSDQKRKEEQE